MLSFLRPADQIIAAMILGSCTLTAALLNAFVRLRAARSPTKGKKPGTKTARSSGRLRLVPRKVLVIGTGLTAFFVGLGVWLDGQGFDLASTTAPISERLGEIRNGPVGEALAQDESADSSEPAANGDADPAEGADTAGGAEAPERPPAHMAASPALDSWLRAAGLTVFYRYLEMLPTACDEDAVPVVEGNWTPLEEGLATACLENGWLAFDLEPLLRERRIVANVTYCLDVRLESGERGGHADLPASAFPSVRTSAHAREEGVPGALIGFRVVREGSQARIVFTDEEPRLRC